MSLNQRIIAALEPLGLPVCAWVADGRGEEWLALVPAGEAPVLCGDDQDLYDLAEAQVHLFSRRDPTQRKGAVRRLLREAGLLVTGVQEFYEPEERLFHVAVTVEDGVAIED